MNRNYIMVFCAGIATCATLMMAANFATKKKRIPSAHTLKQQCGDKLARLLTLLPEVDHVAGALLMVKGDVQLLAVDKIYSLLEGNATPVEFFGRATKAELEQCVAKFKELQAVLEEQVDGARKLERVMVEYRDYIKRLDQPPVIDTCVVIDEKKKA